MVKKTTISTITFSILGSTIFLFILAVILIGYTTIKQLNNEKEKDKLVQDISNQVTKDVKDAISNTVPPQTTTLSSDFKSLDGLKKVDIVQNFESWTPKSSIPDDKVNKTVILEKGKLAKGYILIKASIDGKPLSQWESIYIKLNNIGGHIFRKNTLPVPESTSTQLLYTLNNVPFLANGPYREDLEPLKADWFYILNNNRRINFLAFIASLKPAKIENISIYYECVSNDDCLLSVNQ
jgi:hypothetical protein